MELTDRQLSILKAIIEEYAYTATPVSSKEIINKKYLQGVSSATIRNEMAFLETHGLLEKTHTSSGRIPSIDGYKFYQQFILTPKINGDLKTKLEQIFQNRDLSIDTIIDQSVQIINESFQLPLLVSKTEDENLKRFDLIQLAPNSALVIIVTSSGTVHKNQITIDNEKQFDDLAICIRVFNDRLVDTPISKINDKLDAIKDIIKVVVHEYEFCIRQVIERIFDMKVINKKIKVEGVKYLPTQPEFQNLERLKQILSFLEDTNV
jgi:heat-inducible transcriptional repressor